MTIAHDSGGPKMDIIPDSEHGFLASSVESFASSIKTALEMDKHKSLLMQQKARESSKRFTLNEFTRKIEKVMN